MGAFHLVDILIVAGIALAIFGPKTLQSWARNAGKGVAQAKDVKDKLMSDLPMDDIAKITDSLPRVPLNSRRVVEMLMTSDDEGEKKAKTSEKTLTKQPEEEKSQEAKVSEA